MSPWLTSQECSLGDNGGASPAPILSAGGPDIVCLDPPACGMSVARLSCCSAIWRGCSDSLLCYVSLFNLHQRVLLRAEANALGIVGDIGAVLAIDALNEGLVVVALLALVAEYLVETGLVDGYGVE